MNFNLPNGITGIIRQNFVHRVFVGSNEMVKYVPQSPHVVSA